MWEGLIVPLLFQALASGGFSHAWGVGARLSSLGQLQSVFGDCALLLPPHANWNFVNIFRKICVLFYFFVLPLQLSRSASYQSKQKVIGVISLYVYEHWNGKYSQHLSTPPWFCASITIIILRYVHVLITHSMHYIVWSATVTVLQNNDSVIAVEFRHFPHFFAFLLLLVFYCLDMLGVPYVTHMELYQWE